MIDRFPSYIKPVVFFSILIGLILGVLLVIPVIQLFTFFLFWIIGGVSVYILKSNNFIGKFTDKEAIVIGCITGMISVLAASVSFVPLSIIIGAIFKVANIGFMFTSSFTASVFSLFVLIMLIVFIGLINIIFNIGSALLLIYIYNNLEEQPEEPPEFKVEL